MCSFCAQVERKQSISGCFYLLENLNEVDDYTFWIEKEDDEYNYDQQHALPGSVDPSIGKQSTYVDIVAS